MKVGVISDTHGQLRPETVRALAGCDVILHAGDIDRPGILDRLRLLAPVIAVRGNCDWFHSEDLPLVRSFELAGRRICMAHRKYDLPEDTSAYDLAIFGHSHQYEESRSGKTIFLNPGSCGPRRYGQDVTLAVVSISEDGIRIRKIEIT